MSARARAEEEGDRPAAPPGLLGELERQGVPEFPALTNDDAVDLGLAAVSLIRERDLNLAVDVVLHGDLVFRAKLKATGPENDAWLAGKAAVARRFEVPSLLVRLRHEAAGTPFEARADIDHDAFRAFGGAIPLRVAGVVVGTLTVSGEADTIDHDVAADAVAQYLAERDPA